MRISDWSSDVCSSDLQASRPDQRERTQHAALRDERDHVVRLAKVCRTRGARGTRTVLLRGRDRMPRPGDLDKDGLRQPRRVDVLSSEERRVGKGGVSTWRSRWSPYHSKKNTHK